MRIDSVGIVLAGGRSSRMAPLNLGPGGKASLDVDGMACVVRVCTAVRTAVARVIVVAAEGQPLPPLPDGVAVVRDTTPDGGPLAAIRDGLVHAVAGSTPPRWAFVASCDLPHLSSSIVARLLEVASDTSAAFVVPVVGGHPQVLGSVMACDLLPRVAAAAAAGRGPRAVLDDLAARRPDAVRLVPEKDLIDIDPALRSFDDIDVPDDVARLQRFSKIPPSRH